MSGLWSRTLVYLGLREEDDDAYGYAYGDADDRVDPRDPDRGRDRQGSRDARGSRWEDDPDDAWARRRPGADRDDREPSAPRERRDPDGEAWRREREDLRGTSREAGRGAADARSVNDSGRIASIGSSNVRHLRPEEPTSRPYASADAVVRVLHVTTFDECDAIGGRFRAQQPVLFDTSAGDDRAARRVLDFVSGMTYVARGTLRKVGPRAYLLVPQGVSIAREEQRRLAGLGYTVPPEVLG